MNSQERKTFTETTSEPPSAWDQILIAARNVQDAEGCSLNLAIGRVLGTPRGSDLYIQYIRETTISAQRQERERTARGES